MAPVTDGEVRLIQCLMEIRFAAEELAGKCQQLYKHADEVLVALRKADGMSAAPPPVRRSCAGN